MSNRTVNATLLTLCMALLVSSTAGASDPGRAEFGKLPDGRKVEAVTLRNSKGITATVISYGATLQALVMPDRDGKPADVLLGYATLEGYLTKSEYFGATVGRSCARRS